VRGLRAGGCRILKVAVGGEHPLQRKRERPHLLVVQVLAEVLGDLPPFRPARLSRGRRRGDIVPDQQAGWIIGTTLPIDGGVLAGRIAA
jgi:hypothetical protein